MAQLSVERDGPVAVVTITNPPMGYMDTGTVAELDVVTRELEADDSVRAVVLTGGIPGVFIRHYSVVELAAASQRLREQGVTVDTESLIPERTIDHVFHRLETMPKPVIAAINGLAMGGGFELTLACDIRVAEEGPYEVGLPEIKVGILPGAGGTQRLARLVGMPRALEIAMRGRTVSPTEAFRLGIVQELTPAGRAVAQARAMAHEMSRLPAQAAGHIKRLVRGTPEAPLADGLALERTLFLDLMTTDEAFERMTRMNTEDLDIRRV